MMPHPLHSLILDGYEGKALDVYLGIDAPSAVDDRWAGCALLVLNQPFRAKDLLVRAVARGCVQARIELASAYRALGEWKSAYAEIESLIATTSLDSKQQPKNCFDHVLLLRELAIHQFVLGDQEGAMSTLKMAWAAVTSHEDLLRLRAGIAQILAEVYMNVRRYARAEHYFTIAFENTDNYLQGRAARVLLNRARCRLFQADFERAKQDLGLVREKLEYVPSLTANLEYVVGVVYRAQGDWQLAVNAFELSSSLAHQTEDLDVVFHAELCLAACYVTLEEFEISKLHLARAKNLKIHSERDLAFLEWRSGQVFSATQPIVALVHLTRAKEAFLRLNMPRELLGVFLHIANVNLWLSDSQAALGALEVAANIAFESQDQAACLEMICLPRVQQLLVLKAPDAWRKALMPTKIQAPKAALQVQILTLGKIQLVVDGKPLNLRMSRTVEILAYLLKNPHSSLDKFLGTLFPDSIPRQAANYFHKTRQTLKSVTDAIWIEYNPNAKTYAVQCNTDLYWDAQIIQQLVNSDDDNRITSAINTYTGEFLPTASSQWAVEEREALAWSIIKIGLETLQRWYDGGEHQKCLTLAHRLLEIEPFNTAIYEFVINTTLSLEGELAAKRELLRASRRFVEHLGEVPVEFDRLRHALLN